MGVYLYLKSGVYLSYLHSQTNFIRNLNQVKRNVYVTLTTKFTNIASNALRFLLLIYEQYTIAAYFEQRLGPKVIKLFSCSTQLSMNFFLFINVKMPTIVGILTFISKKKSILGLSEPEKSCIS